MTDSRQPGDAGQEPVATRLEARVEVHAVRHLEHPGNRLGHQQALGRDRPQRRDRLIGEVGVVVGQVVPNHVPTLVLDAGEQLVELEASQPAVGAELDDVALDLLGDPADHLGPLEDGDHVAHRDQVLDLQSGEGVGDRVEPVPVTLQGLQGLIGPADQPGDRFAAGACCRPGRG